MLTVARCTRAAVWNQVTGLLASVSGVQARLWTAPSTLPRAMARLWILAVSVGESLRNLGMECCLTHSLACSQVTAAGRMFFAAKALQEMQGMSMAARGASNAGYAEVRHKSSAARPGVWDLCCRILNGEKWRARTAVGSKAGLSVGECTDVNVGVIYQRVQLAYVGLVIDGSRDGAAGQRGWRAGD